MLLSSIKKALPGVSHSGSIQVVHRPGWLVARSTRVWVGEPKSELDIAEFLEVYRSPLVAVTSTIYAPVADRLLRGEVVDVVLSEEQEDSEMMHGTGKVALYRIQKTGRCCPYSLDQVREAIQRKFNYPRNGDLAT